MLESSFVSSCMLTWTIAEIFLLFTMNSAKDNEMFYRVLLYIGIYITFFGGFQDNFIHFTSFASSSLPSNVRMRSGSSWTPDFIPYAIYCDSLKSDPLQSRSRVISQDEIRLDHDCTWLISYHPCLFRSISILVLILASFCLIAASQPSSLTEAGVTQDQDGFVVQRGRAVPTLTAVVDKSEKEQFNKDTKSEELGESEPSSSERQNVFQQMKNIPVAGRPSESSNSVRRGSKSFSRRNSVDDNASSLSLENLGGSQDNLSLLGRNPDKEMRTHVGRKEAPHEALNNDNRYVSVHTHLFKGNRPFWGHENRLNLQIWSPRNCQHLL